MSDYEDGRLYLFTNSAGEERKGVFDGNSFFNAVIGEWPIELCTNIRPAIVLDPDDEDVKTFAGRDYGGGCHGRVSNLIAAQMQSAKPPMEEPTELGAVVDDDLGVWVRTGASDMSWYEGVLDTWASWSNLRNPRPHEVKP